jgi:hypothetical protein
MERRAKRTADRKGSGRSRVLLLKDSAGVVEVRETGAHAFMLSNREISEKAPNRYLSSSPKDAHSQDCGEAQIDSL